MINRIIRKLLFLIRRTRIKPFQSLQKVSPFNALTDELLSREKSWMAPFYEEYVSTVSRPDMALSLEAASCISAICKLIKPARILDMGSGFSSFLLRTYAGPANAAVVSVDDDAHWLEKTKKYLEAHDLSAEAMVHLTTFLNGSYGAFDLIIFDLNFVDVRILHVADAVERLAPGGIIFFDDVHKVDYLMNLLRKLTRTPMQLFDLKPITRDAYLRHAIVGLKGNP